MTEKKTEKKIDYLDEDPPMESQKWICVSFLSPEGIKNCNIRGFHCWLVLFIWIRIEQISNFQGFMTEHKKSHIPKVPVSCINEMNVRW